MKKFKGLRKPLKLETVDAEWLFKVIDVLNHIGGDAPKLLQPSKVQKDAYQLLKQYQNREQL